ncbi:MAG: hypothetical protein HYZ53_13850 [Planctomycetes bacterium]|nr:hypothetical protein [Planctomycetota bacterium]
MPQLPTNRRPSPGLFVVAPGFAALFALSIATAAPPAAPAPPSAPAPAAQPPTNLLRNGDFELGDQGHPVAWQQAESEEDITTRKKEFLSGPPKRIWLDGLTCFWVDDPLGRNGKCLMEDSDVLLSEFHERRTQMEGPNPPPARPKTPTKPPKYDTIGGTEGVHFFSDFMDVRPDRAYRISVDYLAGPGAGVPKLWLKAYKEMDGIKRVAFKKCLDLKTKSRTEWKTHSMTVNPTKYDAAHEIRWMRVDLYAYWTPGTYYFDNVLVSDVGEEAPPKPKETTAEEDDDE